MKNITDFTIEELKFVLADHPSFRAEQVFKWLSSGADFEHMSNIPIALKEKLKNEYYSNAVKIYKQIKSSDKSVKLLYTLNDGSFIEGIMIPQSYGNSLCVSTQAGCRMGCAFCASHLGGLSRNLTAGEIYSQVIQSNKSFPNPISKIVLMGSGEPLDNYYNTTKFIKIICEPKGLNFSQRNISLSTCGIADKIIKLADENYSVNLSLSLHATTDETRKAIMPIAKKFNLKETINAARYYFDKTGRRVSIEYVLIKGVNNTFFDAKRLKELLSNFSCHINLIMLNHVPESNLTPCTKQDAEKFLKWLTDLKLSATLRKSAGGETSSACGQLRNKFIKEK
ncbi:MAG: 23S rRNA (adenine(2503)-C(2))-methyltransferase RlmN [Firmicutes bacterium]|nr:23S rRNA (adenine(2503)-C(2))-methyltransferase RlmN [Bacillota bacterium]